MEILEAFDLTQSYRDAGELAGCDHKTVAHWVARRDVGELTAAPIRRPQLMDEFLAKLEEWMEASDGKIRADVVFDRLVAVGFAGSARTVRRAVARVKGNYRRGNRRVYRPWIPSAAHRPGDRQSREPRHLQDQGRRRVGLRVAHNLSQTRLAPGCKPFCRPLQPLEQDRDPRAHILEMTLSQ